MRADLDHAVAEARKRMQASRAVFEETKKSLKDVNEQIHYTGQYLATKKTYAAYRRSKDRASFRENNSSSLERYQSAVNYLKDKYPSGKAPSLSGLKRRLP